jgi:CRISPR/Cas system-associated exonuclease Cas4 (RecB family)
MAWSYSSLTAYETCPRRYELTRVTREVVEPQTDATIHGNEVHKALELYVKNEAGMPVKYKQYVPIVDAIKHSEGRKLVEHKWAVNTRLQPVDFASKDAWARGVFDVAILRPNSGVVLDYKTGKPKPDSDQLKLFAAAAFAHWPFVENVKTGYLWLAYNQLEQSDFQRSDAPTIWQEFLARVTRLEKSLTSGAFPARPSGLCAKWCPVKQSQCEYSGRTK